MCIVEDDAVTRTGQPRRLARPNLITGFLRALESQIVGVSVGKRAEQRAY